MRTLSGTSSRRAELSAGDTLGRYELLVQIGGGGMGAVWAARLNGTRGFHKLVAIKTILRSLVSSDSEEMLFQEAMLASEIHHPNLGQTFELAEDGGVLYLVMELIPGEPLSYLRDAATRVDGFPLIVAVNLVGQVCRGLHAAHELCDEDGNRIGIVHRDIAASNIMVTPDGTAKIVDFGIATSRTAVDVAALKGKLSNLAPEQLLGEPVDARTDVFATGLLLYSLTVGRHPFRGSDERATMENILSAEAPPPPSSVIHNYPRALERVVLHAIEKDRSKRLSSAADFLDALVEAVPNAFGPQAESLVAEFAQQCMADRIKERRASLRAAAESAERARRLSAMPSAVPPSLPSGETLSQLSLSLTASGRTVTKTSHLPRSLRWRVAAVGACVAVVALGLGSLRLARNGAADNTSPVSKSSVAASQFYGVDAHERLAAPSPSAGTIPTAGTDTSRRVSAATKSERKREVIDTTPSPANEGVSSSSTTVPSAGKDIRNQVPWAEAALESPTNAPPVAVALNAPAKTVNADSSSNPAPLAAAAPLATQGHSIPVARVSSSPLTVSSRVGHKQLRINPADGAYRPQLPHALARAGQTWDVRVNICVSAEGGVSKVDVIASESPALDRRVVQALSRWRYEPLRVDGEARAFCYPFRYELSGS